MFRKSTKNIFFTNNKTLNSIKIDIDDNFLAFKNTLKKFVQMVKKKTSIKFK